VITPPLQHTDSPARDAEKWPQSAAAGVRPGFGKESSSAEVELTSIRDNWGPYISKRVKAELGRKGNFGRFLGGLKSKIVVMEPIHQHAPTSEEDRGGNDGGSPKASCSRSNVGGRPDGKEVECKGGTHLDDGQVLGMNFSVNGCRRQDPRK